MCRRFKESKHCFLIFWKYVIIYLESYCPTQFSERAKKNLHTMDFRCTKVQSVLYFRNINLARRKGGEREKERGKSTVDAINLIGRVSDHRLWGSIMYQQDRFLRPVRLRIETIARSRRLSHGNPEHNFLHTSFKSPEIMRCCGSVHEYTVCRNTTYGEVYKCFSLSFLSCQRLPGKSRIPVEGSEI